MSWSYSIRTIVTVTSFIFVFQWLSVSVVFAAVGDVPFSSYQIDANNSLGNCSDITKCDNVGAVCNNGPTNQDAGGCGTACGQGDSWSKYEVKCKVVSVHPVLGEQCDERLTFNSHICSTADKCTSVGTPYLNSGSCSCSVGGVYKTCCSNTTPSYIITDPNSGMGGNSTCVQLAVDTTNPPYEGVCPAGSHSVQCGFGSNPPCGQAACGSVDTSTSCNNNGIQDDGETGEDCGGGGCAACTDGIPSCGASCVYSESTPLGGAVCKSGNCLDDSQNCSFNNNCGYVSSCSTGVSVSCPVPNPPPPPAPGRAASCTLDVINSIPNRDCSFGKCSFKLTYTVEGTVEPSFDATLYPDYGDGSNSHRLLSKDFFDNNPPVSWDYQTGTYTARVEVTGNGGAAVCEKQIIASTDSTPPQCTSFTIKNSSGVDIGGGGGGVGHGTVNRGETVRFDLSLSDPNVSTNISGSGVAEADLFIDGNLEVPMYNTLFQNPFTRGFRYDTLGLAPGVHTFTVNSIDYAGNRMTPNLSTNSFTNCIKQLTVSTTPAWVPPSCDLSANPKFSGCTLQGGLTCSDWGTPTNATCQRECNILDPSQRCVSAFGALTTPATIIKAPGTSNWQSATISFNTANTRGGTVKVNTSTNANNPIWVDITNPNTPNCTNTTDGTKECLYTAPNTILPNTTKTFALFANDPATTILDSKDIRFGPLCTQADNKSYCVTGSVCRL